MARLEEIASLKESAALAALGKALAEHRTLARKLAALTAEAVPDVPAGIPDAQILADWQHWRQGCVARLARRLEELEPPVRTARETARKAVARRAAVAMLRARETRAARQLAARKNAAQTS